MDEAASEHLTLPESQALLTEAFATWTAAGGACVPSMNVIPLAPSVDPQLGYSKTGTNENDVFIRDGVWPYVGADSTFELTTTAFELKTGELLDADIEFNGNNLPELLTDAQAPDPAASSAMRRVFVHAAGHFLGFSHSPDPLSVMYEQYAAGDQTPPELTADDAAGMCTAYPPNGERPTLDAKGHAITVAGTACTLSALTPAGIGGTCSSSSALRLDHGCAVARVGASSEGAVSFAGLGLVALFTLRYRRRLR